MPPRSFGGNYGAKKWNFGRLQYWKLLRDDDDKKRIIV
jgi:hypothetical protein